MNHAESPQYFTRSPEQFGGKIPFIVTDLIEKLRELDGAKAEGIFRLSGPTSEISDLCSSLDHGRVKLTKYDNVHTIACTLKKYFRDMVQKDPLVPYEYYDDIISIPKNSKTPEEAVLKYKEIIHHLSISRQHTLAYLFRFLKEVMDSPTSKMNANNISIVFAPNILASKGSDGESAELRLKNNSIQNKTFALMVENTDKIFDDINITQASFITDEDLVILSSPPIDVKDIPQFIEIRALRRQSLIPFVPYELLENPNFVRPNRVVHIPKNE